MQECGRQLLRNSGLACAGPVADLKVLLEVHEAMFFRALKLSPVVQVKNCEYGAERPCARYQSI